MAEQEVGVINHLLEVEQNAAALIQDAQIEADKRINAAKIQAESMYKERYDKLVAEQEDLFAKKSSEIAAKYEQAVSEYKQRIVVSEKHLPAFSELLDNILFA